MNMISPEIICALIGALGMCAFMGFTLMGIGLIWLLIEWMNARGKQEKGGRP